MLTTILWGCWQEVIVVDETWIILKGGVYSVGDMGSRPWKSPETVMTATIHLKLSSGHEQKGPTALLVLLLVVLVDERDLAPVYWRTWNALVEAATVCLSKTQCKQFSFIDQEKKNVFPRFAAALFLLFCYLTFFLCSGESSHQNTHK